MATFGLRYFAQLRSKYKGIFWRVENLSSYSDTRTSYYSSATFSAFPDGVSNVRHSSGKAISLLPQEYALLGYICVRLAPAM